MGAEECQPQGEHVVTRHDRHRGPFGSRKDLRGFAVGARVQRLRSSPVALDLADQRVAKAAGLAQHEDFQPARIALVLCADVTSRVATPARQPLNPVRGCAQSGAHVYAAVVLSRPRVSAGRPASRRPG